MFLIRRILCDILLLFTIVSLVACSKSTELLNGLSEVDANDMIAALRNQGVWASKVSSKRGITVNVEEADLAKSVVILSENGLPKQSYIAMGDVFKKDGMISTPTEERGRYLFAISQELEKTLSQIDGVILARVHPVLPERIVPGEPISPSSCAVLIKHYQGWDSSVYESRIRQLVMAGIPGLSSSTPQKISIVFIPSSKAMPALLNTSEGKNSAELHAKNAMFSRSEKVPIMLITLLAGLFFSICIIVFVFTSKKKSFRELFSR